MNYSGDINKHPPKAKQQSRFQIEEKAQHHYPQISVNDTYQVDNQVMGPGEQQLVNENDQPEESPPRLNLTGAHLNGRTYASEDHEQALNNFNYTNLQRGQTLISVEAEIPYQYNGSANALNYGQGNRTIEMVNSTIGTTTEVVDNISVKGRFRVQERTLNAQGQNNSHGDEMFSTNHQNHGYSNQIQGIINLLIKIDPAMDGYDAGFDYHNLKGDDRSFQVQTEVYYSPIDYAPTQERFSHQAQTQKNQYLSSEIYQQQSQEESKGHSHDNMAETVKNIRREFNRFTVKKDSDKNSSNSSGDKENQEPGDATQQNRFKLHRDQPKIDEDEDNMADREDNNAPIMSNKNSLTHNPDNNISPKLDSDQFTPNVEHQQDIVEKQHVLNSGAIQQDQEDQVNEADVSSAAVGNDNNDDDKEESKVDVSLTQSHTKSHKKDLEDSFFNQQPAQTEQRNSRDLRSDQSQVDPESKAEYNSLTSTNEIPKFNNGNLMKNEHRSQINVVQNGILDAKNINNSHDEPVKRFERLKDEVEAKGVQERFTLKNKNKLLNPMQSMEPKTLAHQRGTLTAQPSMRNFKMNEAESVKDQKPQYKQLVSQESGQMNDTLNPNNNSRQFEQKSQANSTMQTIGASPKKMVYQPKVSFAGSDVEGYPSRIMNQSQLDLRMISPNGADNQFEEEKVSSKQLFGDFRNDSRSISSGKKPFERVGSRSYTSIPFRSNMMNQSRQKSNMSKDNEYDQDGSSKGNNGKVSMSNGSNLYLIIDKEAQTAKHNPNNLIVERGMSSVRSQKYITPMLPNKPNSVESEKSQNVQEQSLSPDNEMKGDETIRRKPQFAKDNMKLIKKAATRKKSRGSNKGSSLDCEQKGRFLIRNSTDDKATIDLKTAKRKSTDKLSRQGSRNKLNKNLDGHHGSTSSRTRFDYMKDYNAAMYQHIQQMTGNQWQDSGANTMTAQMGKTPLMIPTQFYMQSPATQRYMGTSPGKVKQFENLQSQFNRMKKSSMVRDGYDEDSDSPGSSSDNERFSNVKLPKEEDKTDKSNKDKKKSSKNVKEAAQRQTPMFPLYNLNGEQVPNSAAPPQMFQENAQQQFGSLFQSPFLQPQYAPPMHQIAPYSNQYNQGMQNQMLQFNQYAQMQQQMCQQMQFESMTRSMSQMFTQMVTSHGQIITQIIKSQKQRKQRHQSTSSEESYEHSSSSEEETSEAQVNQHLLKNKHNVKDDSFFKYQPPHPLNNQGSRQSRKSKGLDSQRSSKKKELEHQIQQMKKELNRMKKHR